MSVDGWASTHQAWLALFPLVVLLRCFLHGWLNIRSRGKLSESFRELSRKVWESYRAASRRSFAQRLRRLREWARGERMSAWLLEQVEKLCGRSKEYAEAYSHPGGHRTSNMLDRVMRAMNRYFDDGQHLHGGAGGVRPALPGVGAAVQLPAVEPGDGAGQRRLAEPGGAAQRAPLPRRLAPEPADLRLPGRIPPMNRPAPNSGTVRFFILATGYWLLAPGYSYESPVSRPSRR